MGRQRGNLAGSAMLQHPIMDPSYNISLRHVFQSTCKLYYISLIILVLSPGGINANCSLKFEEYKTRRISALRYQILTKLGLAEPLEEFGPAEVPEDLMEIYNETVSLIEERYASKHCSKSDIGAEEEEGRRKYFAKVPIIITAIRDERTHSYFSGRQAFARFYSFNISQLDGLTPRDVEEVKLRFYQLNNTYQSMDQVLSVFKLVKTPTSYMPKHIYTAAFNPQHVGPVTIDVTEVVKQWMEDEDTNNGFEVSVECSEHKSANGWNNMEIEFADPAGSYTASTPHRGDQEDLRDSPPDKHPKLVVMTSRDHSEKLDKSSGTSSRKKRYSSRLCDDSVTSCCKRELWVNFRRDLGWKWIRQPKGFYPNFCAGNCLYIQTESMYHHVLKFYRNTNPTASPSPCCAPMSFKPLTVLFYDSNARPQIATLEDVVVDSCRCS